MVYKNRNGQPRERAMVAAYSLVKEFGATQSSVAEALGCSQPTITNWVKEVGHKAEVEGLKKDLDDARAYIQELHEQINQQKIEYNVEAEYDAEDDEADDDFVPDYGYEDDDDNFEHALDDVLKARDM